ncbi:hypothetical protein D9M71_608530 [compost metagenome]
MQRAGSRQHFLEGAQRNVAIDRQWGGQAERADAADRVAGQFGHFLGRQHLRLAAERFLELAVVQPRIAARDYQHGAFADAQGQRLGDPPRFHAMGLGGEGNGSGAGVQFDDVDVGGLLGEEGTNRFQAHGSSPLALVNCGI